MSKIPILIVKFVNLSRAITLNREEVGKSDIYHFEGLGWNASCRECFNNFVHSLGRRAAKLCKKHITGTSPGFASFTRFTGKTSLNNKVLELAIDKSVQVSLNSIG